MRQILLADAPDSGSKSYGSIFGDRSGFTPVITVVYERDDEKEAPLTFAWQVVDQALTMLFITTPRLLSSDWPGS